jgi:hypothetical protein
MNGDSTIPKVTGTPTYAGDSKRVRTSILSILGAVVTIATLLANVNKWFPIVAGIATAIIVAVNQIYGMQATGPVTTTKEQP